MSFVDSINPNNGKNSEQEDSFTGYRERFNGLFKVVLLSLVITVVGGMELGIFHYYGSSALLESIRAGFISIIVIIGSIFLFNVIYLLFCFINSEVNNVIVFPFESMDPNIDGNAIADILIMKIKKINDIYNKPLEISPSERLPLSHPGRVTDSMSKEFDLLPLSHPGRVTDSMSKEFELNEESALIMGAMSKEFELNEESALIMGALEGVGNLDIGLLSLPIGRLLISLHRFRRLGENGCIIQGSIQKYGDNIYIISHIRTSNYSFIREIEGCSLHEMVKNLAFVIAHKFIRCNKIEDCKLSKMN